MQRSSRRVQRVPLLSARLQQYAVPPMGCIRAHRTPVHASAGQLMPPSLSSDSQHLLLPVLPDLRTGRQSFHTDRAVPLRAHLKSRLVLFPSMCGLCQGAEGNSERLTSMAVQSLLLRPCSAPAKLVTRARGVPAQRRKPAAPAVPATDAAGPGSSGLQLALVPAQADDAPTQQGLLRSSAFNLSVFVPRSLQL